MMKRRIPVRRRQGSLQNKDRFPQFLRVTHKIVRSHNKGVGRNIVRQTIIANLNIGNSHSCETARRSRLRKTSTGNHCVLYSTRCVGRNLIPSRVIAGCVTGTGSELTGVQLRRVVIYGPNHAISAGSQ